LSFLMSETSESCFRIFWFKLVTKHPIVVEIYITWGASHFPYLSSTTDEGQSKIKKRLGHTKFTSCSSDFVLKTLSRASKW
jgi:hypothetical protein